MVYAHPLVYMCMHMHSSVYAHAVFLFAHFYPTQQNEYTRWRNGNLPHAVFMCR